MGGVPSGAEKVVEVEEEAENFTGRRARELLNVFVLQTTLLI